MSNNNSCLSDSYLYSTFAFAGSISLFIALLKCLTALRKFFWREGHNLAKRYGRGTWAMITAPTSPTGNGFAVQLARLGFNIVLVGKDIERLHKTRDLLILRHNIKVRTVVADFGNSYDLSFYTDMLVQVEDLDISILVHAVGMAALSKKFHQQAAELNKKCLVTNMFAPVLLSQHLIPRLQHRYHRSAIVIVSGENAHQPFPGMAVSSGSNSFLRHFAVAASVEYEDKIDIMSVEPLAIKKRSPMPKQSESIFVVESEKYARACLKQLGHERSTSGHWIHQLQSWAYSLFPEELKLLFWVKLLLPQHLKTSSLTIGRSDSTKSQATGMDYIKNLADAIRKQ